jgi:hypothetical protein
LTPCSKDFDAALRDAGFLAMSGQIIDTTIVAAPKQGNTDDEEKPIKEGRVPKDSATRLRSSTNALIVCVPWGSCRRAHLTK